MQQLCLYCVATRYPRNEEDKEFTGYSMGAPFVAYGDQYAKKMVIASVGDDIKANCNLNHHELVRLCSYWPDLSHPIPENGRDVYEVIGTVKDILEEDNAEKNI